MGIEGYGNIIVKISQKLILNNQLAIAVIVEPPAEFLQLQAAFFPFRTVQVNLGNSFGQMKKNKLIELDQHSVSRAFQTGVSKLQTLLKQKVHELHVKEVLRKWVLIQIFWDAHSDLLHLLIWGFGFCFFFTLNRAFLCQVVAWILLVKSVNYFPELAIFNDNSPLLAGFGA